MQGERNTAMIFPERFLQAILDSGKTHKRISEETDIAYVLISKYVRGISLPSAPSLSRLADCLGVTVDYLLGRTEKDDLPLEELKKQKALLVWEIHRYRKAEAMIRHVLDGL